MRWRVLFAVLAAAAGLMASTAGGAHADDGADPATASAASETIVYYFHGDARCATCKTIEAYADEAVRTAFPEALARGELVWRAVNVDEPENRHFIGDFQLTTRSVVLAEYRGGEVVRFENLDQVWRLVRDKDRFLAYVQDTTREFLEAD